MYVILHLQYHFPTCHTYSYPVLPTQPSTCLNDCEDEEGAEMVYSSGEENELEEDYINTEVMEEEQRRFDAQLPMLVLPLYSLLPAEQQAKVWWIVQPPEW